MNREQFATLLVRIQVLDNRQLDKATADAWWPLIGHLNYDDALTATNAHYRDYPDTYLKPGHIVQGVRRINAERNAIHDHGPDNRGNSPRPDNLDAMAKAASDPDAWQREVDVYNQQLAEAGYPAISLPWAESNRQSVGAGRGGYRW